MKEDRITLRCKCGGEAAVFANYVSYDGDVSFELSIEDSYIGGDYRGFFGRIKRAWKAFCAKPVVYTSIFSEDKDEVRKFLTDCLDLVNNNIYADSKDIITTK